MTSDGLSAVSAKISSELARRPECFITHPSEMCALRHLPSEELQKFAHERGWRVVRRLGGRQLQFYNDTTERLANEASDER